MIDAARGWFFKTGSFLVLLFTLTSHSLYSQIDSVALREFIASFPDSKKVQTILSGATFQPTIIEKMTKPAEGHMTWEGYRAIFVKEDRIQAGVTFWSEHEAVIKEVSESTGVAASVIVGIIGVETFYGQRKGTYKVLDALYTLAFGFPKRSSYFKAELSEYLSLIEKEGLDPQSTKGSYAGAMGFCQFMPTSYTAYAVSYDAGGKRDLVNEVDDAIASVANYLKMHRWKSGEPIAVEAYVTDQAVELPAEKIKPEKKVSDYLTQGYEPMNRNLASTLPVSLLAFDHKDGTKEYWFTSDNFYCITRYNHSPLYALAVYQLGSEVEQRRGKL